MEMDAAALTFADASFDIVYAPYIVNRASDDSHLSNKCVVWLSGRLGHGDSDTPSAEWLLCNLGLGEQCELSSGDIG